MGDDWLNYRILGNEVWRFGAVLLIFLGAFVLYRLYCIIAARLTPPELKGKGRKALFDLLRNLLRVTLPFVALWLSLHVFLVPDQVKTAVDRVFLAALTLFILYALTKLVNVVTVFLTAKAAKTESTLDDQLVPLLGKTIKWFIWIIGGLLFLQNVLNYNISSLLAGLGVGGLAIAFAAQDTVANIFGAIMIFVDRPFKVGDAVSLEGFEGSVESIGLRSTRIRTWDGTLVTIPNRTVASANINNLAARPMRRTNFTIGLVYDTPTEKLEEALSILREILGSHPATGQYRAYFNRFGDFSLNILVQHWCKVMDYEEYLKSLEEINFAIKRRFEAAGLEFAFPTQTIELKK
jgi:MscS family membrane protein